ncbi:MAG: M56 family metallopeptidase [Acidobacteriota bacterium]|nr:M56 family metallopeptidase [Acidobacteriota bacterium]
MNLFTGLQNELAVNYAVLWRSLGECGLFDGIRMLSLALFAVLVARLGLQFLYLSRLNRASTAAPRSENNDLWTQYRDLASAMGLKQAPPLYFYHHARLPAFTLGVFKPRVFLSPRFMDRLDREERGAVLAHELGHVARRDNLVVWVLETWFAAAPLFAVVLLGHRIFASWAACVLFLGFTLAGMAGWRLLMRGWYKNRCEHACDDHAISRGTQPLVLASSLVKAWEWMRALGGSDTRLPVMHALLLGRSCLERRVTRLVDYRKPNLTRKLETFSRAAGLVLMLSAGVFLFRYHVLGSYRDVVGAHMETIAGCPTVDPDCH